MAAGGPSRRVATIVVLRGATPKDLLSIKEQSEGRPIHSLLVVDPSTRAQWQSAPLLDLVTSAGVVLASTAAEIARWVSTVPPTDFFEVVPAGASYEPQPFWDVPGGSEEFVWFRSPSVRLPLTGSLVTEPSVLTWCCSRGALEDLLTLAHPTDWDGAAPIRALQRSRRKVTWRSAQLMADPPRTRVPFSSPAITRSSQVLAIVPYYACDDWLRLCLTSLTGQTRPPDAIVVVDDASPRAPREIVAEFDGVTLLRADVHGGQWAALQQVIDQTNFDAYLHQDADDFSACDRLERLLVEGEDSGASLIGTQALQFDWDTGQCRLFCCPASIPSPTRENDYSVLHPSSIVSAELVRRLHGFATGLPFGGDAEFQHRARFTSATMSNVTAGSYFKILHSQALTVAPSTGMKSPARDQFRSTLRSRFAAFFDDATSGRTPDLSPLEKAPPVSLTRMCGPPLGSF
jgi:hypothetical protein